MSDADYWEVTNAEVRIRVVVGSPVRAILVTGLSHCHLGVDSSKGIDLGTRGCKNFCVNGHLAGNCLTLKRSEHDRSTKSTIAGSDRSTAGWLP